jgi:hypothetical protein
MVESKNSIKGKVVLLAHDKGMGWGQLGIYTKKEIEDFKKEFKKSGNKYGGFSDGYALATITEVI